MKHLKGKRKISRKEKWLLYKYRLAHHPLCQYFSDHVYHLTIKGKSYYVCKGCVNLNLGMIFGTILAPFILVFLDVKSWEAFIATWVLFLFTPLGVFFNLPRKIKDFFRFLLGIGQVSAIVTVILSIAELIKGWSILSLIVCVITLVTYFVSRKVLMRIRERRNREVCLNCDQYYLPHCEGMSDFPNRQTNLESSEK